MERLVFIWVKFMKKKGDLFGDGVNLAARIQPIAETDGTVCTQSVYNAIRSDNTIFLKTWEESL